MHTEGDGVLLARRGREVGHLVAVERVLYAAVKPRAAVRELFMNRLELDEYTRGGDESGPSKSPELRVSTSCLEFKLRLSPTLVC